jgi:hypothetical protein
MNTLLKIFGTLAAISLLMSACVAQPAPAGQDERLVQAEPVYRSMLGKPLTDEAVSSFISGNDCSSADRLLLCQTAGLALWTDSNQKVETVYLYLNNADGFAPYTGELPFGLKFYDTMEAVEYKLKQQGIGDAGQPDAGATPDRMHYQASYHQAGLMIIYNYPFPDEGAMIRAVVITNKKLPR